MKRFSICVAVLVVTNMIVLGQDEKPVLKPESKASQYENVGGCPKEGVSVWPFGDTLYPNSIILIQGLGKDQNLVQGLGSEYRAYLSSTRGNVHLKVVDQHDSRSNVFQCLLKPETELQVGVRYKLVFERTSASGGKLEPILFDENSYSSTYAYHRPNLSKEKRSWVATKNSNAEKKYYEEMLLWEESPYAYSELEGYAQATNEMVNFEMSSVHFKFSVKENRQFFVKVRLTDKQTQQESTFYVIPDEDKIRLGRPNMCYGNYEFRKDEIYRVRFQIIDIYGYENRATREHSFVSPR